MLSVFYHKISLGIDKIGKKLPIESSNIIAQIEALTSLQIELKLSHALPPTRGWAASPDFLNNLVSHTLKTRPTTVVECSSGISTVVLARCIENNGVGHIYSLEHDAQYAKKTRDMLKLHGLSEFATVLDAPLRSIDMKDWSGQWYSRENLPKNLKIDQLVIDGPPWFVAVAARYPAVPLLHEQLNHNAVIFLDDSARPGEKIAVQRWLNEFSDLSLLDVPSCEKGCVAIIKLNADDTSSIIH